MANQPTNVQLLVQVAAMRDTLEQMVKCAGADTVHYQGKELAPKVARAELAAECAAMAIGVDSALATFLRAAAR